MIDRIELLESALDGLADGMVLLDQEGRVAVLEPCGASDHGLFRRRSPSAARWHILVKNR